MDWLQERKPNLSWEDVKEEIQVRFGGAMVHNPFEALAAIK